MWKPFAVLIVSVWAIFAASSASAISFEARNFDTLTAEADQIVIGTVASTSSRRTGAREIVTDFTFADLEVIKGTVADTALTLTMLGGTVGTETLTVGGAPTFKPGIRYLVFVTGNGSVMFPVVGGHQGIFQMRKDAVSGVSRVHDYAGRALTRLPGRADAALADRLDAGAGEHFSEAGFADAIRANLNVNARGAQ
jgi:hypothetical protein